MACLFSVFSGCGMATANSIQYWGFMAPLASMRRPLMLAQLIDSCAEIMPALQNVNTVMVRINDEFKSRPSYP